LSRYPGPHHNKSREGSEKDLGFSSPVTFPPPIPPRLLPPVPFATNFNLKDFPPSFLGPSPEDLPSRAVDTFLVFFTHCFYIFDVSHPFWRDPPPPTSPIEKHVVIDLLSSLQCPRTAPGPPLTRNLQRPPPFSISLFSPTRGLVFDLFYVSGRLSFCGLSLCKCLPCIKIDKILASPNGLVLLIYPAKPAILFLSASCGIPTPAPLRGLFEAAFFPPSITV